MEPKRIDSNAPTLVCNENGGPIIVELRRLSESMVWCDRCKGRRKVDQLHQVNESKLTYREAVTQ